MLQAEPLFLALKGYCGRPDFVGERVADESAGCEMIHVEPDGTAMIVLMARRSLNEFREAAVAFLEV